MFVKALSDNHVPRSAGSLNAGDILFTDTQHVHRQPDPSRLAKNAVRRTIFAGVCASNKFAPVFFWHFRDRHALRRWAWLFGVGHKKARSPTEGVPLWTSARPPSVGVAFWGFGAKTHAHRRRACERGRTPEERGEASRKLAGVFLWAATPAFCISTLAGFETPESQCEGVVVDIKNCDKELRNIETRASAVRKVKSKRRRQTEPIADVIDRLRKGRCDCKACAAKPTPNR